MQLDTETREARNMRIVALALEGKPPAAIRERTGDAVSTIYNVLRQARANGIPVPVFHQHADPVRVPRPTRPAPAAAAVQTQSVPGWSAEDDERLSALVGRGLGITAVAALMRRPYAAIIQAQERLGLSRRAGGCE